MFEALSDRLEGVFSKLRSKGKLTEADVDTALREVRLALLEADVNFRVVKDLQARIRDKTIGQNVMESLTPAQHVVKIVHDELVELLGGGQVRLETAGAPPTIVMLVGLQGSGKTTSAAKLALHMRKQGRRPLLVAADVYRPAAVDQLVQLGKQLNIPVYSEGVAAKPPDIAVRAVQQGGSASLALPPHGTNQSLYTDANPLSQIDFAEKAKLLTEIDAYARGLDPRVRQVTASLAGTWQAVEIIRADGARVGDVRPLVRLNVSVVVGDGDKMETGSSGAGGRVEYQRYFDPKQWKSQVEEALRHAGASTALGRMATVEEVADAVLFFIVVYGERC